MAIQKEFWIPAIEENLYRGIEIVRNVASDDSAYVNNKTVHVPNAGAAPTVSRGNTTYPALIKERTDSDVDYTLTNFEVGPVRLGWADQLQLSYDKVQSITNDFMGNLNETVLTYFLSQMFAGTAADNMVDTTGGTETNWLGGAASGSLKKMLGADVRSAAKLLDRDKMPSMDRHLLLDYAQFWQLLGDVSYNDTRIEIVAGLPSTIDNIYGFKVYQLPYVLAVTTNAGNTVKVPAASDGSFTFGAANRPCGLAFHKSAVSWAMTPVEAFVQEQDPTMFGDVLSASIYGGAKYRRADKKGVVAIRSVE